MKTIVALGAHHDDVELRCGGTLAKYVNGGHRVIYVILTTTPHYYPWENEKESEKYLSNQEVIELRKREATEGAHALGISDVYFFDFKSQYWYKDGTVDRRYFDGYKTTLDEFNYLMNKVPGREFIVSANRCQHSIDSLKDFLRDCSADVVLTHTPDDAHWEHYASSCLAVKAVRGLRAAGVAMNLYGWEYGGASSLFLSFAPTHFVDIGETIDAKCESLAVFKSQFTNHDTGEFLRRARARAKAWGKIAGLEYAEPFMRAAPGDEASSEVKVWPTYDGARAEAELF